MSGIFSILLDLVIAGLLITTIVYAVILNRQLTRLRESRAEMEGLIKRFTEATSQADAGVKGMKRAATESGEVLQKNIERAISLRDEFRFLIDSAESLVARLENIPGVERPSRSSALRGGGGVRNEGRGESLRQEALRSEPVRTEKLVRSRPSSEPRVVTEARIESMRDVVREAMRASTQSSEASLGGGRSVGRGAVGRKS
ncbi:hypothetical protein CCP2SC5_100028 [Azospirillaceae bacterium]